MEMYISVFFIYCLLLLVLQPPARREHGGVDGHAHVGAVLELEVVEHVGATGGGRVEVRVVLLVREGAPVDAAEGQYVRGVVARASVRERVDVRVEEARVVVGPRFVVEGLVQADYLRVALDRAVHRPEGGVVRGRRRAMVAHHDGVGAHVVQHRGQRRIVEGTRETECGEDRVVQVAGHNVLGRARARAAIDDCGVVGVLRHARSGLGAVVEAVPRQAHTLGSIFGSNHRR